MHPSSACPSCPRRDKSSALNELTTQHRALQAEAQAMAAETVRLRESLSSSQQRAQRAEVLTVSLQAQCAAFEGQQAALTEEAERLRSDLQQVGAGAWSGMRHGAGRGGASAWTCMDACFLPPCCRRYVAIQLRLLL